MSEWQIRNKAEQTFAESNPRPIEPKYTQNDAPARPQLVKHHSGRLWVELVDGNGWRNEPGFQLRLTIDEAVHCLSIQPEELSTLRTLLNDALFCAERIEAERKDFRLEHEQWVQAHRDWEKRCAEYATGEVNAYLARQAEEEKDQDSDPDEYEEDNDEDEDEE